MKQGAGETAQAVKGLPHEHEDLSLDPQDPALLIWQKLHSYLPSARSQTWEEGACMQSA